MMIRLFIHLFLYSHNSAASIRCYLYFSPCFIFPCFPLLLSFVSSKYVSQADVLTNDKAHDVLGMMKIPSKLAKNTTDPSLPNDRGEHISVSRCRFSHPVWGTLHLAHPVCVPHVSLALIFWSTPLRACPEHAYTGIQLQAQHDHCVFPERT